MAIELAAVYVPIIPSLKGAAGTIQKELGLTDTSKVGTSIGTSLGGYIGTGIKSAATGTVATAAAGIGTALVKGFGRLNALDQAQQKLTGLGHSAESVDKIMGNALASVRGTAFGMDAAATVAASAVAAGIKPGQDLERTLSLVADAATIAGTDMGSMGAIFNKVAASNKVQMDVINQLHDAGVPALAALADYMGVTAEEASKMASAGEIDFATFQAAMESSLGGAAASSGNTFSGAMANVGAALGRVGAGILGGIFPKLAPLFQSVTTALGPLEDKAAAIGTVIGDKVAPVLEWMTTALSGGLGQIRIAPQIIAPLTGAFVALGSSGLGPLLKMVPGLGGLATRLGLLGGPVGLAIAAFAGLVAVSPELQAALGTLLSAVTSAGTALAPILGQVAQLLAGALVTAINVAVPVISSIVTALAGLISWLTDSEGKVHALTTVLGIAAGAWLTYKGVVAGVSFAKLILELGRKAVAFTVATAAKAKDMAITAALSAMYVKDFVVAAARTIASVAASTAAWVANTAALVASKAAMIATRVAMTAATAAQWLFNAALSANPIGIVITLITALVAGLVWFFTQTELGQQIWSAFMTWLGEAWANIVAVGTAIWEGLGTFFTDLWNGIVSFVTGAWTGFTSWITSAINALSSWWNGIWSGIGSFFTGLWDGIVNLVVGYVKWYVGTLMSIIGALASWWNGIWSGIGSFFTGLWNRILNIASSVIQSVRSVITNVVGGLASWWNGVWSGIGSFFSGLWNRIVGTVSSGVNNVIRFVSEIPGRLMSALSGAGNWLVDVGRNIIQGLISGITSMVQTAINAVIDVGSSIINGAKSFLGIHSPSRVFRDEVGQMVGLGLAVGIEDSESSVKSAMDSLVSIPQLASDAAIGATLTGGVSSYEVAETTSAGAGMRIAGPLVQVEEMVVDSDERVDQVAQELWERAERASRASGKVNLGGAVVTA